MANHDNMGPGTPGNQSEGEDIKLWQPRKSDTKKKKSYIYEVPAMDSEGHPEPDPEPIIWKPEETQDTGKSNKPKYEYVHEIVKNQEQAKAEEEAKAAKKARAAEKRREEAPSAEPKGALKQDAFVKSGVNGAAGTGDVEELTPEQRRKSLKNGMINGTKNSVSFVKRIVGFFRSYGGKVFFAVLVLALILGGLTFYNRIRHYRSFTTDWQVSATDSGYSNYIALGDKILHYSQDGVNVLDLNGNILWDQAFNMDVPAIAVRDDYILIYDVKGKDFYICNSEGCTGNGTTEKKILKGDISASGVVTLVLDDKKCNYINYFRNDGSQIDIEIKTLITGDGYPLDIAISPDGVELMTSYIYAEGGKMLSEVVFRNFEVGKNDADRVVGGFKGYEETLVPDVMFFSNESSAAVTEHSLDFYSTKNALRPELTRTVAFEESICAVASNDHYVAVILEPKAPEEKEKASSEETAAEEETKKASKETAKETEASDEDDMNLQALEYNYQLKVFDQNGKSVFEETVEFPYTSICFSGEGLFVYNKTTCAMYNMTGVRKYQGPLNVDIDGLMRFGEKTIVAYGSGALQKMTLK